MSTGDRRVKERLVGASILLVLIVLIVPELLSGPPAPPPASARLLPASTPEPVRNITVDLATSKAPATEPVDDSAASSAEPRQTRSAAAATAEASSTRANVEPPAGAPPAGARPAGTPPAGTSTARLETAAPSPRSATAAAKSQTPGAAWAVQLGSFASRTNADKLVSQLKAQGFPVYVVPGGSGASLRYRVRIGPMADRGSATQAVAKLKSLGHVASFVPPAP